MIFCGEAEDYRAINGWFVYLKKKDKNIAALSYIYICNIYHPNINVPTILFQILYIHIKKTWSKGRLQHPIHTLCVGWLLGYLGRLQCMVNSVCIYSGDFKSVAVVELRWGRGCLFFFTILHYVLWCSSALRSCLGAGENILYSKTLITLYYTINV